MFNLEKAIADWRERMVSEGVRDSSVLDELESHLRIATGAHVAAGRPESEAFQLAVSRLGKPASLHSEFGKLARSTFWPVKIGSWMFLAGLFLMAAFMSRGVLGAKVNLLLAAHVFFMTAGYVAAFLAGTFAIIFVCCRAFNAMLPYRQDSLDRAVLRFCELAVGFVIVAFVLGMIWCHQHFGTYLLGTAKEIGAVCVIAWFAASAVLKRGGWTGERVTMAMGIGGNILVSVAWFGVALIDTRPAVSHLPAFLPLALSVFIGLQVIFILMGLSAERATAES